MGTIASRITSLTVVYSTVYSDTDQRKHQSSASLAFLWGIHRGPVNSPHKWPVTRKMFPFDDFIMNDIIRHHAAWSTLVQVMACCLFSIKPLFKLMLIYCPLSHLNKSKHTFYFNKNNLKASSAKWWSFYFWSQWVKWTWCQRPGSSLVQVIALCLFGTELLHKPMFHLIVSWICTDKLKKKSFIKIIYLASKCIRKCHLWKC